jgi:chromosomal replication initiator protein
MEILQLNANLEKTVKLRTEQLIQSNADLEQINKEITVENIQKLVADHLKIPVETLFGKTRKRSIVIARQLSMYLAKTMTDKSLKNIGEVFGGRDHSTVIYSIKTVQDLMETDTFFKETVLELEKKIKNSLRET